MSNRRTRRKKSGTAGLLVLEAIAVIAFAGLLTTATSVRNQATLNQPCSQETSTPSQALSPDTDVWQNHRPRFSEVVGDLWSSGF